MAENPAIFTPQRRHNGYPLVVISSRRSVSLLRAGDPRPETLASRRRRKEKRKAQRAARRAQRV